MAVIDGDDVRRLFRGLVNVLNERDPERLHAAFQVAELYQQLLPYRVYRARLGFDTNQDYEAAVLGLLAGLGGYATLEPAEAQETLAAEAGARNPDPSLFREFAGARVKLNPTRIREVLGRTSTFAPPPPPAPPGAPAPVFELEGEQQPAANPAADSGSDVESDPLRCRSCGEGFPGDRTVVFCPWCGKTVGTPACPSCGDELEADWRFCPRCGAEQRH